MEKYKKAEHGGNVYHLSEASGVPVDACIDFSANINPLGPPAWLKEVVMRELGRVVHYPDRYSVKLREAIGEHHDISPDRIVPGNGTTELMYILPRCLPVRKAVIPVPSYGDYEDAVIQAGLKTKLLQMQEEDRFVLQMGSFERKLGGEEESALVFIGQPNNPTGTTMNTDHILDLARQFQRHYFCIDEAFAEFIEDDISTLGSELSNLIILRSFTKFFAIPGLRLGWLDAEPGIAGKIRNALPTWSVNSFSQAVGLRAVQDEGYRSRTMELLNTERSRLKHSIDMIPNMSVISGEANYLFGKLTDPDIEVADVQTYLRPEGIAIRNCGTFRGLTDKYFRIAVRTGTENDRLITLLRGFFESR